MKQRVLVIQRIIPHYRLPVFNQLGREFDFTVAHSDPSLDLGEISFKTPCLPDRSISGLHWQAGVSDLAKDAEVIIAGLDLHWLSNVWLCMSSREQRFVWWGHGFGRNRIGRVAASWLSRRADALLLIDEIRGKEFERAGTDPAKIFAAPNTIDVPNPQPCASASDRVSFLYVGRLQERKKLELLIDAFAKIADQLPEEIGVDIVGGGELRPNLEARIASAGLLNRVRMHGAITEPAELRAFFHRAIAYVSPGDVGLGVLHAFGHGVPVITQTQGHHGPEIENVKHGKTGLLLDAGVDAYADGLLQLGSDRERAHQMGLACHARYTGFRTLEHMLEGFRQAIRGRSEQ